MRITKVSVLLAALLGGFFTPAYSQVGQLGPAQLYGNPTSAQALPKGFSIQSLAARGSPDSANDKIPIYDNAAGTIKYATPSGITNTISSTIFSILNSVCSTSATRPACISFMNYSDVRWWGCIGNNNPATDNRSCIQASLDYMQTTFGGGKTYFPNGTYCVSGPPTVTGSAEIAGSGMNLSAISGCGTDTNVLYFNTSTNYAFFHDIAVYTSMAAGATSSAVIVDNNVVVNMTNCTIIGGYYALDTNGVDGRIINCYIAATSTVTGSANLHSKGGNWFIGCKFDQPGALVTYGIKLDVAITGPTGSSENHFVSSDFSGSFTGAAIYISSGVGNQAINTISDSVIGISGGGGNAITTTGSKFLLVTGTEIGGAVSIATADSLALAGSQSSSALTITGGGTRSCAANLNITC